MVIVPQMQWLAVRDVGMRWLDLGRQGPGFWMAWPAFIITCSGPVTSTSGSITFIVRVASSSRAFQKSIIEQRERMQVFSASQKIVWLAFAALQSTHTINNSAEHA